MKSKVKQFVFRVSNGRNQGPFRGSAFGNPPFHDIEKFYDSDLYPNFLDDGLPSHYMQIAALPNACALFHWFGEDLDVLQKNKFRVHRIEVRNMNVGRSGHQVTYHRRQDRVGKIQVVPIQYKGLLLGKRTTTYLLDIE